jgi:hypothetical protein
MCAWLSRAVAKRWLTGNAATKAADSASDVSMSNRLVQEFDAALEPDVRGAGDGEDRDPE